MVKLLIASLSGFWVLTPTALGSAATVAPLATAPASSGVHSHPKQAARQPAAKRPPPKAERTRAPTAARPRTHSAFPTHVIELRQSQARIQHHIVIRVPRVEPVRRTSHAAPLPPIEWVEARANDCISTAQLTGSATVRQGGVDLDLSRGRRVRAQLGNECPAIDFYAGFYVRANSDGKVCAKRDVLRLRSGGECRIRGFRTLIPGR